MRRDLLVWIAAGALTVAGGCLAACGSSDGGGSSSSSASTPSRPAPETLSEGLTVIDARADWGVNAAFKQNGRVVYFESRVGSLKPQVYREQYPDEPQYEMDERFIDAKGGTFIVQMGGDQLIDAAWPTDIAMNSTHPIDRDLDFQAARAMTQAMRTALPAEFQEHLVHAANLTRQIPSEMPELQARVASLRAQLPAEVGYNASCDWNWWEGDLYGKSIFLGVAHHSAIIGWNYSNCTSTWDEEFVACNHGTCATDGSMGYQCYTNPSVGWVGNYQDVYKLSLEQSGSIGTVSGACATGYNWDTPPGHECNDDSEYELWQVKSASQNTSYGGRSNFGWTDPNGDNFSCNCGTNGGCSNDWNLPQCP